ncbi:hypothetical protein Q4560_15050 [Celeribacter halophilus]|uniref:DUF7424 domain-containing protein n=1 Tax=Celeribacter halophilus TaxID=576117 RepID=A0AAW7XWS6_9RHOB|nr:hypothetical protein [Celeribacter halophilus]MDO6458923.1 hypothetical protein [Celeribacter halophilus]MDO6724589.1 hypothetical protein [Celeribacter halophilus]
MKRITLIATCFVLAGCKTQISADLFTSDLIAATEAEAGTVPLVIGMEASTEQNCKETADTVLVAVQSQFDSAEFIGCEAVDFNTFARFRVQAEIVAYDGDAPSIAAPFSIGVRREGTAYHVSYLTNPAGARAIWDALPKEMTEYQTYKLEPFLSAVLNNDLRETVRITTDDVYADGVPIQGTATRDLSRRDQVELSMSDVTNAAFGTVANASHIVTFTLNN